MNDVLNEELSEKNTWIYFFLMYFFGVLGIHKFYLNKNGKGILYLLTCGIFTIGIIFDYLYLLFGGKIRDNTGKFLQGGTSLLVVSWVFIIGYIFVFATQLIPFLLNLGS